jgi:hypothetical protein
MKYGLFDEIRNCGKFCFRAIRQNRMTLKGCLLRSLKVKWIKPICIIMLFKIPSE